MAKIEIEKVSNGYIITTNSGERAIAKTKQDVGEYFGNMLANSINAVKDSQIATLEINAKIEDK